MKNRIQLLTVVFVIAVAVDITGIAANIAVLHYFAKPVLLPVLIVLLATATPAVAGKKMTYPFKPVEKWDVHTHTTLAPDTYAALGRFSPYTDFIRVRPIDVSIISGPSPPEGAA